MTTPRRLAALLLLLAAAAPAALAKPLDLDRVSAKAVWLMHADMDAARGSSVMTRMYERAVKKHAQLETMLAMGAKMMGMDPRKDLHDVTLYGLDTDKKNAVMIVHADANREFLEKMVEKARDHETMKHRDYTLHKWRHQGWKGRGGETVFGAFHRDDVMVFARSADRVQMALDVLDDKAESAGPDGPLAGRTRPGSILVARAAKVDPDTKCPVLRQGEGFRVALGENDGRSFYRARLDMESAEAAKLAEDVADGFAATAVLGLGKEKGVMKLVDGLETMTDGKACMITWEADADDVWVAAEAMAEKIEAKMAARRKQWGGRQAEGGACEKGECPMEGKERSGKGDERRPFRDDEF